MATYRITKFDPAKRNEVGAYTDHSEWTSISDIGKAEYRNLTYKQYEGVETAYISALKAILAENGIVSLEVEDLELHTTQADFIAHKAVGRLRNVDIGFDELASLKNGLALSIAQLDKIVRLILRETVWMNLVALGIKIQFGYDYYMYVKCNTLSASAISRIQQAGLFVE